MFHVGHTGCFDAKVVEDEAKGECHTTCDAIDQECAGIGCSL